MPIDILMPALSPTMTEGNLVKWLKKEGDKVSAGDVMAEIETDKATMEVEAVDEGTIGKILVSEGTEGVKVNQPIAILLEEGEDASVLKTYASKTVAKETVSPSVQKAAPEISVVTPMSTPASYDARVFASPLARRIAEQQNVNLSSVKGTGPRDRVVKADVEQFVASGNTAVATRKASQPIQMSSDTLYTDIPLNNMRKVIAQRLTESKQNVPHFYLTIDCEIDKLLAVRQEMNAGLETEGVKLSVNDFIIKASALALQAVPAANSSWGGTHIRQYSSSDISVAVAIEGGLITPIVKAAHLKSIATISTEMKELAQKAREGKLAPAEFQGGTFSISNLGMYGIKDFAAVINPPQGCILAIGSGDQRPVVHNGEIRIATVMTCTLSVDHRAVDGAVGSEFLKHFKKYITNPLLMFA